MLSHEYKIVIDRGVGAPGHEKYVVDSLRATEKRFLTVLMTTVKIPGADTNNAQVFMHTEMSNTNIILERVFQKSFRPNTCTCID